MSSFSYTCPQFDLTRADLFGQLSEVPALNTDDIRATTLFSLFLYGSSHLNIITNLMILDTIVSLFFIEFQM